MKLTPLAALALLAALAPSSESSTKPATWVEGRAPRPVVRSVASGIDPPVDGPATGGPAAVLAVSATVAGPRVETGACGAGAAFCGAVLELSLLPVDDVVTEVEPAVGAVVLCVVATVVGLGCASLAADSRIASDGFELPYPLTGTVVLVVAGFTVVLVLVGAAVVGGVVVATVAPLADVPWAPVEVPAGADAGAVSAEAGPAFSTRKSPVRSAKVAAHLRGLTTSILGSVLIRLKRTALADSD